MIDIILTILVVMGLTLSLAVIWDSLQRHAGKVFAIRHDLGKGQETRSVRFVVTEDLVSNSPRNVVQSEFRIKKLVPVPPLHELPAAA